MGDIDNIQKNAVMDRYRVQVQTVLVLFLFVIKWQTQIRDLLNRSKDEEISFETKADLSSNKAFWMIVFDHRRKGSFKSSYGGYQEIEGFRNRK